MYNPDQDLPGCMMPDGGEACPSYARLHAAYRELQSKLERCKNLLGELFAMVEGECPSLLSEDSGGDAELGLQIEEALSDG